MQDIIGQYQLVLQDVQEVMNKIALDPALTQEDKEGFFSKLRLLTHPGLPIVPVLSIGRLAAAADYVTSGSALALKIEDIISSCN